MTAGRHAGSIRWQARLAMICLAHGQVKRELIVQVAFEPASAKKPEQPPIERTKPAHESPYALCMTRAMAPATRVQEAASRSSSRRPWAVRV